MTDLEQLDASRERLETLDCLLDWRIELLARARRAQLIFELVDINTDEIDAVAEEMSAFNRICRQLTWRSGASVERSAAA
jgi:hypothetical protein